MTWRLKAVCLDLSCGFPRCAVVHGILLGLWRSWSFAGDWTWIWEQNALQTVKGWRSLNLQDIPKKDWRRRKTSNEWAYSAPLGRQGCNTAGQYSIRNNALSRIQRKTLGANLEPMLNWWFGLQASRPPGRRTSWPFIIDSMSAKNDLDWLKIKSGNHGVTGQIWRFPFQSVQRCPKPVCATAHKHIRNWTQELLSHTSKFLMLAYPQHTPGITHVPIVTSIIISSWGKEIDKLWFKIQTVYIIYIYVCNMYVLNMYVCILDGFGGSWSNPK